MKTHNFLENRHRQKNLGAAKLHHNNMMKVRKVNLLAKCTQTYLRTSTHEIKF